MPVLAAALARGFSASAARTSRSTIIAASVPTASASYILARQLGGNAPLMAEILTLQTLLAMATMPLAIGLLAT